MKVGLSPAFNQCPLELWLRSELDLNLTWLVISAMMIVHLHQIVLIWEVCRVDTDRIAYLHGLWTCTLAVLGVRWYRRSTTKLKYRLYNRNHSWITSFIWRLEWRATVHCHDPNEMWDVCKCTVYYSNNVFVTSFSLSEQATACFLVFRIRDHLHVRTISRPPLFCNRWTEVEKRKTNKKKKTVVIAIPFLQAAGRIVD